MSSPTRTTKRSPRWRTRKLALVRPPPSGSAGTGPPQKERTSAMLRGSVWGKDATAGEGLFHHRGLEDAHHAGAAGLSRDAAHHMVAIATVTKRVARAGATRLAARLDLEFSRLHGEASGRAALLPLRFENAAGLGVHIIPLEPFEGLYPADDGELHLAVLRDEDGGRCSACLLDEGLFIGRCKEALDRDVERLAQPPDGGERGIRLVALDLAYDRFRDARLFGKLGE